MRKSKALPRAAYDLTYKLKKQYPFLVKTPAERIFHCPCEQISDGLMTDKKLERLKTNHGFQLQLTLI